MALVNRNETRNFNAVSALVEGNSGTPIMYMNASYNGKELNFTKNIQDLELYKANQKMVDTDYANFQTDVIEEINV